ncbi:MAG: hypothetical protein AAGF96_12385 [Bacteroidota bacterium]
MYMALWGTGARWSFAVMTTLVGPVINDIFKENLWLIFTVFTGKMVPPLSFASCIMPETEGIFLENIQEKIDLQRLKKYKNSRIKNNKIKTYEQITFLYRKNSGPKQQYSIDALVPILSVMQFQYV